MTTHIRMERSLRVEGKTCTICERVASAGGSASAPARALAPPSTAPVDGVICAVSLVVEGASVTKFVCRWCAKAISVAMLGDGRR